MNKKRTITAIAVLTALTTLSLLTQAANAINFETPKTAKNGVPSGLVSATKYLFLGANHRYNGIIHPGDALTCYSWNENMKPGYIVGLPILANINYEIFGICAGGTTPGAPCTVDGNCVGGGTCTQPVGGTAAVNFLFTAACGTNINDWTFPSGTNTSATPVGTLGTLSQAIDVPVTVATTCAVGKRIVWLLCRDGAGDANNDAIFLLSWSVRQ